ncbi:MAG: ribbon-helix-helix protein, CopG family, partial [Acidimicrobiales bacterium]|nr:ribbon-helix-helix protein, CopG family [Acidimicrobiales bacterium]
PGVSILPRMSPMSVTFDLPEETLDRLRAEADRRGVSVDDVIAELASQLPTVGTGRGPSFVGVGASGTSRPIGRRHREIIDEEHRDKKASDM